MSVHGTGHEEEERTWPLLDRYLGLGRSEGGGKRGGCGFRAAQAGLSLDPRLQASIQEMGEAPDGDELSEGGRVGGAEQGS